MLKKKIWASFQRIIELFTQKFLSLNSKKYGVGIRDPRSGKKPIPNLGSGSRVKKAPDPGSGSATLPMTNLEYDDEEENAAGDVHLEAGENHGHGAQLTHQIYHHE